MTTPTTPATARFDAAKLGPDYARAMARARPEVVEAPISRTVLVLPFIAVPMFLATAAKLAMAGAPASAPWHALFVVTGTMVGAVVVLIVKRRRPITRRLAIVDVNWTDHERGGREVMLQFEDGTVAPFPASEYASHQADAGTIGVGFFRGRALIAFERLDA